MSGSSWPRRDRPRWRVASIDPERPGEITAPIPLGQCERCATGSDHDHEWSEVDREVFGRVTLRRSECVCNRCGRCGERIVYVEVARG